MCLKFPLTFLTSISLWFYYFLSYLQLELDKLLQQFKTLQRKLQDQSENESKETLVMQIEENYDHLITEGDKLMEIRKLEKMWVEPGRLL